jgi:hypothetical protein
MEKVTFLDKLTNLFDSKLRMLENKFKIDIEEIEMMKYEFYDVIKKCK